MDFLVLSFGKMVILSGEIDNKLDSLPFRVNFVTKDKFRQPVEGATFFDTIIGFLRKNRVRLAEADDITDKLDMILIAYSSCPIELVDGIRAIIGIV